MKQTFAFLTILLIFTSQVFGQVKTLNKDGKAIILNDDGTWRYDDSNSVNISNKNNLGYDRIYYLGKDVRGNKFKNHQLPKKNKD